MSTDDVAQRARQFLDLAGKVLRRHHRGMDLALVEVALPTIAAQRDDALAEVERLRATVKRVRAYVRNECGPLVADDGHESYRMPSREKLLELLGEADR